MSDAEFRPVRPFDIDSGQLDGLRPQDCFVLGYELAIVDEAIRCPLPIGRPVHAKNRDRIEAQFKRAGRDCSMTFMHDDQSEEWLWLSSGATDHD